MSFNYESNIGALVTCLKNANTTTASPDLSASLTTRVQNVYNDVVEVRGIRTDHLPALFVSVLRDTDSEEYLAGGLNSRKKRKSLAFEIVGVSKREGASQSHEEYLPNLYRMASNLQAVLKRDLNLSGTALKLEDINTEFQSRQIQNTWIRVFATTFNAVYEYQ